MGWGAGSGRCLERRRPPPEVGVAGPGGGGGAASARGSWACVTSGQGAGRGGAGQQVNTGRHQATRNGLGCGARTRPELQHGKGCPPTRSPWQQLSSTRRHVHSRQQHAIVSMYLGGRAQMRSGMARIMDRSRACGSGAQHHGQDARHLQVAAMPAADFKAVTPCPRSPADTHRCQDASRRRTPAKRTAG